MSANTPIDRSQSCRVAKDGCAESKAKSPGKSQGRSRQDGACQSRIGEAEKVSLRSSQKSPEDSGEDGRDRLQYQVLFLVRKLLLYAQMHATIGMIMYGICSVHILLLPAQVRSCPCMLSRQERAWCRRRDKTSRRTSLCENYDLLPYCCFCAMRRRTTIAIA